MDVEVLTGPQGCGKSSLMRSEAIAAPARYLWSLPTIDLADEQVEEFRATAPGFEVVPVHSGSPGSGSVARKLADAHADLDTRGADRVVVLITHETMMGNKLGAFAGWHARIDEAPAAIQAGNISMGVSRPFFEATFDLNGPEDSEWASVSLKADQPTWKDVAGDTLARGIAEFQKQAARPETLFVRASDWSGGAVDWFSMWTPLALEGFASVAIAGSSYTDSVGFKAAQAIFTDRLDFRIRPVLTLRTGQPTVCVYYFTEHQGSTKFWATSEGRQRIRQVCDHLSTALHADSFWSGNEVVQHLMEHRLPGVLVPPVASGLNKHRHRQSAAFIFSGKARPDDRALMEVFDLSTDEIRDAREGDAIAQFSMRGAIRNSDYAGAYAVYVYEKGQADRLAEHLARIGILNVETRGIPEAGLMTAERPTGRPSRSPEQAVAKKAERSAKAAERGREGRRVRAEAEGRQPGRPGNPRLRNPT